MLSPRTLWPILRSTRAIPPSLRGSKSTYVESAFDSRWRKLKEAEQTELRNALWQLNAKDWTQLTLEEKKNLYTVAYDLPERKDPNETLKLILGVLGVMGAAYLLSLFARSLASPPAPSYNAQWYEETKKIQRERNADPISAQWKD